jgi:hypothetical protein
VLDGVQGPAPARLMAPPHEPGAAAVALALSPSVPGLAWDSVARSPARPGTACRGALRGIPVTYYYHCFSDSAGTIQLVGFTGRSLLNRPAIERFVAGFEVLRR